MTYRSSSVSNTDSSGVVTVTPPAGIANDDFLVDFSISDDSANTLTHPSGFTDITGSPVSTTIDAQRVFVGVKKAASESGNYVITASGNAQNMGGVIAFQDVDTSGGAVPHRSSTNSSNSANSSPWNIDPSSFTATGVVCDLCLIVGSDVTTSGDVVHAVASSGFTLRHDMQHSVNGFINGAVFTLDSVSSGEIGGTGRRVTGTLNAVTSGWAALLIAIPHTGGGGGGGAIAVLSHMRRESNRRNRV